MTVERLELVCTEQEQAARRLNLNEWTTIWANHGALKIPYRTCLYEKPQPKIREKTGIVANENRRRPYQYSGQSPSFPTCW